MTVSRVDSANVWVRELQDAEGLCANDCGRPGVLVVAPTKRNVETVTGPLWCSVRCWGLHADRTATITGPAPKSFTTGTLPDWNEVLRTLRDPGKGDPGIESRQSWDHRDVLLYRGTTGAVTGVLTRDHRTDRIRVWVDPMFQRQGIGTALGREAARRWPIKIGVQSFSEAGWWMAVNAVPAERLPD